jgi:hypothetical protein
MTLEFQIHLVVITVTPIEVRFLSNFGHSTIYNCITTQSLEVSKIREKNSKNSKHFGYLL